MLSECGQNGYRSSSLVWQLVAILVVSRLFEVRILKYSRYIIKKSENDTTAIDCVDCATYEVDVCNVMNDSQKMLESL